MKDKYRFFVVDDDADVSDLVTLLLESAGHEVEREASGEPALSRLAKFAPDCVFVDLLLPDMDGMEFIRRLRASRAHRHTKIIVISTKTYPFDRKRALSLGANAFILKPLDSDRFLAQVERICRDHVELTFWGVRGTLPVPGLRTLRYGGNTSCISMEFAKGNFLIFDAGTGIKALSDHLLAQRRGRMDAKIFITHPHWDHINALPFFAPLYTQGNAFEILGASHGEVGMEQLVSAQMDGVFSPITVHEFGASIRYRNLREGFLEMDNIRIRSMLLNHPGTCLGYRVEYGKRAICYITDNEIYPRNSDFHNRQYIDKLTHFVADSDVLIIDSTYTDEEYSAHMHWGHSSVREAVMLAHEARAKTMCLFHHDPDQSDDDIDVKLRSARTLLERLGSETRCEAPAERQLFLV